MPATLMGRPSVFERGDHVYLTTPLTLARPTDAQVEEFAFKSAIKSNAPNEHIGWLDGRYVEAGRANLNGHMWLSDELALKQLTPMLMPITVMHDPRTAVGTIADCQLVAPGDEAASSATSRIDTVLAVWKHRFPQIWEEAEANIEAGTMMQSMECFAPSYACSECGQQFVKLAEGKERASWCDHLQHNSSRRILQDVCFTGTGLIFGTRGGTGAYTEAHLDHFQSEIAEFHGKAHVDSCYRPSEGSPSKMGLVNIDETELSNLRSDRDKFKAEADAKTTEVRDLTTKVETAEAETAKEKTAREAAEKEAGDLKANAQKDELKGKRLDALGDGFLAKLGEFTRERLTEAAGTQSDEAWEATLKEKEEMAGVKRDVKKDGTETTTTTTEAETAGSTFKDEEVASFNAKGGSGRATTASTAAPGSAAAALARSFRPGKPAETAKS